MASDRVRNLLDRSTVAFRAGDYAAAKRFCSEVLERRPADSEALNILGAVAFTERDFGEAERLFLLSSTASVDNSDALFNLGKVLEVQRRFDEAAEAYRKILRRQPDSVETQLRLGIVRYQLGAYEEAIATFGSILQRDPGNATAALSLGVTYNTIGKYDESVLVLRRLLVAEPDHVEAQHALADSLIELHRADDAVRTCESILAHNPNDAQATILLGQAECDRENFSAAERYFRRALLLAPDRHEAHMNLGVLFQRTGRIDEALEHGKMAIEIAPREALAHVNYGMGLLLAGDLAKGLPAVEWRLHDPRMRGHFPYRDQLPLWTGERLSGKLLVAREQGLGDFVVFSRFFQEAAARVSELVVEVPQALLPLYAGMPGMTAVPNRCEISELVTFTAHVPLCSLAFVLGVDQTNIPANIPYLAADENLEARFRRRFAELGDGMKIGLVWSGSPGHLLDRYRSCPASAFAPLAGIEGVHWISLQKGTHETMNVLPTLDLREELTDFGVTAAAIAALDLVVSVDTAVAHVAAALGKPVWLLNGFGSYWLWQLNRADSPWYPTMRLFRQKTPNDWTGLFMEVRAALAAIR